ncbi:peptidoglycan editing factor PgeF [Marinobacter sp. F4218]|uniref:peptidoglycan editing factor PgeF n=1 Tax=Marinobacter sp. F4218 TaxID=2862868 RepID=UPI001C62FB91|nr:peptidoglycan editing factor PgeF [Marinobacter sp. F4218]MBW7473109.1 peptidoglycan editing factor PgeF [Marinobacter sp. F4218]
MNTEPELIWPEWPAPTKVRAVCTTRQGGESLPPWDSLNLGTHVEDDPHHVEANRRRVADRLSLSTGAFGWLSQVHGTDVVTLPAEGVPVADASVTARPGQVCAILTADCLPVLLCNRAGTRVAAAHAGWRGLCNGVLERVVRCFDEPATELMAWLGPAIGSEHFEVGPEVREAFIARNAGAADAFSQQGARPGHFMADIYRLTRQRLESVGVDAIYGNPLCTVSDSNRFYSYRRDGRTGRMATLIWLDG